MLEKVIEFALNTPEGYWFIIKDYHLHKSFFGAMIVAMSYPVGIKYSKKIALRMLLAGIILVCLSILGHIYTGNTPYFKLWDRI